MKRPRVRGILLVRQCRLGKGSRIGRLSCGWSSRSPLKLGVSLELCLERQSEAQVPIVGSYLRGRRVVSSVFSQMGIVMAYSCVHWLRTNRNVMDDFPI